MTWQCHAIMLHDIAYMFSDKSMLWRHAESQRDGRNTWATNHSHIFPPVDVGTCRGRGDKVVIASPLTCLSLTSCLLSCKGVTHAAHRGNEKIRILWEKNKICCFVLAAGIFYLPNNRAGFSISAIGTHAPARPCLPPYCRKSAIHASKLIRQVGVLSF